MFDKYANISLNLKTPRRIVDLVLSLIGIRSLTIENKLVSVVFIV